MPLSEALVPEFDQELTNTCKALERVPDDKLAWNPHVKSMTLGRLATHIAEIPHWAVLTIDLESLDLHSPAASTMPRSAVLRRMIFSHIIHHRAQLGVYLRLNDVPVPGPYGPSADEQ